MRGAAAGRPDLGRTASRLGKLEPLLALGADLAGIERDEMREFGGALLSPPDEVNGALGGGLSELNNDGCPIQLCLTMSGTGHRARVIADPAWWHADQWSRLEVSRRILTETVFRCGAAELLPLADRLFEAVPTEERTLIESFGRGFVWIGASPVQPGVAVYLDARPLGKENAWDRALWWLGDTGPAYRCVERLRRNATVASLGFEGFDPAHAVKKLYFRLARPVRLSDLGAAPLADPAIAAFLSKVVERRRMNLSGTVFSLGFDLSTGTVVDGKVDLCAHCLPRPRPVWAELIAQLGDSLGLCPLPAHDELIAGACDVAFLGVGVGRRGRRRLNVYLRPALPDVKVTPATRRNRVIAACRAAAGYLRGLQDDTGGWADYSLPVGASTEWVTGFAGHALARMAAATGDAAARAAAVAAAGRLVEHRAYPVGWGYNDRTGVDADSTAVAIRLLRVLGIPVEGRDQRCLLRYWRPEGGFATYDGPKHWGMVHPCVTAIAAMALGDADERRLRKELLAYLERTIRHDGTWPAYWWRSHYYSTFHHLLLLRRLCLTGEFSMPSPEAGRESHKSAFELAYAAGIACLTDDEQRVDELLTALLARQRFDGGWSGGADLRVTDPDCADPWASPRGRLYTDRRGVITTASALLVFTEILGGRS